MCKKMQQMLTEQEQHDIIKAIERVEQENGVQIVPVIARKSDHYHSASHVFGFTFMLIAFCAMWFYFKHAAYDHVLTLPLIIVLLIVSNFVGQLSANLFPHLKLFLISKHEMHDQVKRSAEHAFFRFHHGIVIYVSLFEHMVYIQGSEAINNALKKEHWESLCHVVTGKMQHQQLAHALKEVIAEIEKLLRQYAVDKAPIANKAQPEKIHFID